MEFKDNNYDGEQQIMTVLAERGKFIPPRPRLTARLIPCARMQRTTCSMPMLFHLLS